MKTRIIRLMEKRMGWCRSGKKKKTSVSTLPFAPSTLFSDIIIIMGSSQVLLRQEVRSCGTGSTRFSPASVLCRNDVVSVCSHLNGKPACAAPPQS